MIYEEVNVVCPSCSSKHPVLHEVLNSGVNLIVKCTECGSVHPTIVETPKSKKIKVIVSKGDTSFSLYTSLTEEYLLRMGDEIFIEDESNDEVYPIIITALEAGPKRYEVAQVSYIETIWGRAIDEVCVKIAIHEGTTTKSLIKRVPGGYQFTIGENEKVGAHEFKIVKIKERDGTLKSKKDTVMEAKNIKRIFASPAHKRAWGSGTSWSSRRRENNSFRN